MENLLAFFLILFSGVFFTSVFKRFHVPWVVTLILGGIIIGPNGLEIFHSTPSIDFIGEVGLIFLMFMAGLEVDAAHSSVFGSKLFFLAIINGLIPFIVGLVISNIFGLGLLTSLLIGVVFVSSSIAIVVPILEGKKLFKRKLGKYVVLGTIIQDISSLVMLSLLFQSTAPTTALPLHVYYIIVPILIAVLWYVSPLLKLLFPDDSKDRESNFQQDLRTVFLFLLGIVVAFEFLGMHPIIGGFFAGLLLSNVLVSKVLVDKLKAIGYGFFIPTFFVIVGAETNIGLLFESTLAWKFAIVLVVGSMVAKYVSGIIGGRVAGFSFPESSFIGAASIPQLSTTLAVTYSAQALGIFSDEIVVSMVLLSIVTTFVGPLLMSSSLKYIPSLNEEYGEE